MKRVMVQFLKKNEGAMSIEHLWITRIVLLAVAVSVSSHSNNGSAVSNEFAEVVTGQE